MTNVAIVGASGYTARELFRILARHPRAKVVLAASRDNDNPLVASLHPSLVKVTDLRCEQFDAERVAARADVAFLCLPHATATPVASALLTRGVRVIDLSADYRLRDPEVYANWYGVPHGDTENLRHAVYGLSELFAERIASAKLVANPGCYPTTAILGLAPLLKRGLTTTSGLIIDSKSGVSGAGRSPKLLTHFPECNESVSAYNVGRHRHTPEIEQILGDVAGAPVSVLFTPHLIPMDRGMFSTIYAPLASDGSAPDEAGLLQLYRDFYDDKPFVRVVDHLPSTKDTVDTNFCDITVRVVHGRAVVLVCLDNLLKGASGAAVECFNLMFGHPWTMGLN